MRPAPVTEIFENLKRFFVFAHPSPGLDKYVEFFAESSASQFVSARDKDFFACRMFPSYTPTFFINLTGHYQLELDGEKFGIGAGQDILLLRDTSVQRINSPGDNIFTVKFHAGTLRQLFNIAPARLNGSFMTLDNFIPRGLLQAIREATGFAARVELMSDYLKEKTHNSSGGLYGQLVDRALNEQQYPEDRSAVYEIAASLHVSSKTLTRYFVRELGVSPKKYFSVIRFRKALNDYLHNKPAFHPFDYGYYDHSHFSREVLQFTGKRLKQQ
ncbi:MAG: AraC family transcriptional regulator [Chitinophagaceae bacterium]|nr:AraC family transcriptional regulator [Chitinophagaceae bacterium]